MKNNNYRDPYIEQQQQRRRRSACRLCGVALLITLATGHCTAYITCDPRAWCPAAFKR